MKGYESCPTIAPFLGYMGVMASIVFASKYTVCRSRNAWHGRFVRREHLCVYESLFACVLTRVKYL